MAQHILNIDPETNTNRPHQLVERPFLIRCWVHFGIVQGLPRFLNCSKPFIRFFRRRGNFVRMISQRQSLIRLSNFLISRRRHHPQHDKVFHLAEIAACTEVSVTYVDDFLEPLVWLNAVTTIEFRKEKSIVISRKSS
eukprot:scaffold6361_cov124-Cylindrotheca_fusiformis.AAC.3